MTAVQRADDLWTAIEHDDGVAFGDEIRFVLTENGWW